MTKNEKLQEQLTKVFEHIEIYNREMGIVQTNICNIQKDIADMSAKLDKAVGTLPTWATVVISTLMGLLGIAVGVALHG